MATRRVSPAEAQRLLGEGWLYLDVRSVPEFEQGHAPGAYNVPIAHYGDAGMEPNEAFIDVVKANFPPTTRIVAGCKASGRSTRAAMMLEAAGYTDVVVMAGGFHGEPSQAGWAASGLQVEPAAQAGRCWEDLHQKK